MRVCGGGGGGRERESEGEILKWPIAVGIGCHTITLCQLTTRHLSLTSVFTVFLVRFSVHPLKDTLYSK